MTNGDRSNRPVGAAVDSVMSTESSGESDDLGLRSGGSGPSTRTDETAATAATEMRVDAAAATAAPTLTPAGSACASPKNPFRLGGGGGGGASITATPNSTNSNQMSASATTAGGTASGESASAVGGGRSLLSGVDTCSAAQAVQLAAEELVRQVQQSNAAMTIQNPFSPKATTATSAGASTTASGDCQGGDASVCSVASASVQSVPSVDVSLSPRNNGGHSHFQQQQPAAVAVGGAAALPPFPNLTTPANAQTHPPQQPFTLPAKLRTDVVPPSPVGGTKSTGNTPTNHDAAQQQHPNILIPPLYLSENIGANQGAAGALSASSLPPTASGNVTAPQSPSYADMTGVMLGVQQLEKQQAEHEAARVRAAAAAQAQAMAASHAGGGVVQQQTPSRQQQQQRLPQSQGGGVADSAQAPLPQVITTSLSPARAPPTLHPPKQLPPHHPSSTSQRSVAHDGDTTFQDDPMSKFHKPMIVYGYLKKQTRNGTWQKRFFETDGENLSYYKSQKRTKLLATLDLAKVGIIAEDPTDYTGCTFTIQVAGRPYYLRAEDRSTCKDWVINLNRVREARIRVGRIKLVDTATFPPTGHFDPNTGAYRKDSGEDEMVSRVVVKANRTRTSRLTDDEEWRTLYNLEKEEERRLQLQLAATSSTHLVPQQQHASDDMSSMVSGQGSLVSNTAAVASGAQQMTNPQHFALPTAGIHALASWDKRSATNFEQMKVRLIRWARKIRMLRCTGKENDVVLSHAMSGHDFGGHDGVPGGTASRGGTDSGMVSFDTNLGGTHTDENTLGDSDMSHPSQVGTDSSDGKVADVAWIGKETHIHLAQQGPAVVPNSIATGGGRRRNDTAIDAGPAVSPRGPSGGGDEEEESRTLS